MKFLISILFILIAQFSFSQSTLETQLVAEQQKLVTLKDDLKNLKINLNASGIQTSNSEDYLILKTNIKNQKSLIKNLKKEIKLKAKENQLDGSTNVPLSNKAVIRSLKKQIKSLEKQKNKAEKLAQSIGVPPSEDATTIALTNKINSLRNDLNELQPPVEVINSSVPNSTKNHSNVINAPLNSKEEAKVVKKQIKSLKKELKTLLKQAKLTNANASKDEKIVSVNDQLYDRQVRYAILKSLPRPEKKILPNHNLVVNNNNISNQDHLKLQQPIENPTLESKIKFAKKELKSLQKQQRKAVKKAIKNQINPAEDNTVQILGKQISTKQQYLQQLLQGVNVSENSTLAKENVAHSNSVEVNKLPSIGISTILFKKFDTEVQEKYNPYLSLVALQLKENPNLNLILESYTDNSEKNRISEELTHKMALSVAQELINRGVEKNRLVIQVRGSKKPIADNNNFYGQARNRRVELSFIKL